MIDQKAEYKMQELWLKFPYAKKSEKKREVLLPPMEENEKRIYDILCYYPLHIDHITKKSNMDSATVASLLTGLELKGAIRQLPGKMFLLI